MRVPPDRSAGAVPAAGPAAGALCPPSLQRGATSGGMYFSSCLASTSSATNAPFGPMAVRDDALPLAEQVRQHPL